MRIAAALVAAALLAPVFGVRAYRLANYTRSAVRELRAEDFERRREMTYGYCRPRGYGYVTRVLRRFPDRASLPRIEYGEDPRRVETVLPEIRYGREPRVLVGIGLEWDKTAERTIQVRLANDESGGWRFRLPHYELLTGVRLRVTGPASADRAISLTIYETPHRRRVIGRWTVTIPAGGHEGTVRVSPAIEHFAIDRGGYDFLIDTGNAAIQGLDLDVVPVDTRNMTVVHRDGECLTAIDRSFLSEIEGTGGAWAEWLADLRSTR